MDGVHGVALAFSFLTGAPNRAEARCFNEDGRGIGDSAGEFSCSLASAPFFFDKVDNDYTHPLALIIFDQAVSF